MGRKCRITTALFAKAADFSRMDLTSEEYVVLNGASCLAPDNFYEELAFHSLMQAQHWRDDKNGLAARSHDAHHLLKIEP